MAREGVPLIVIQRQLGHTNLGITSIYLQGIDSTEIIAPSTPAAPRWSPSTARYASEPQTGGRGARRSSAAGARPTEQRAAQCGGSRRLLLPPESSGLDLRSHCSSGAGVETRSAAAAVPRCSSAAKPMVRLIAALPRVVRSGRPPPRLADVEVVRGLARERGRLARDVRAGYTRRATFGKGSGARVRRRPPASARRRAALVDRRGDSRVLARQRNSKSHGGGWWRFAAARRSDRRHDLGGDPDRRSSPVMQGWTRSPTST
jgi:hypothetical protein